MKIGDRYYSEKYKSNGTVIAINGHSSLIKWDKEGRIQPLPCWIDSKGNAVDSYR